MMKIKSNGTLHQFHWSTAIPYCPRCNTQNKVPLPGPICCSDLCSSPKKTWRWADFLQYKNSDKDHLTVPKGIPLKLQTKDHTPPVCQGYIWSRGCWWKLGFFVLVENFRIRKDKSIFGDGLCLGGTVFVRFVVRVIMWKLIVNEKNARLGPIAGGWQLFGYHH